MISLKRAPFKLLHIIYYPSGLVHYKQPILAKALFIFTLFRWLKPTAMKLNSLPSHLWGG